MGQARILKKLIFALLPVILLLGAWGYRAIRIRNTLCGLKQVPEDTFSGLSLSEGKWNELTYDGIKIPYNAENHRYYISVSEKAAHFSGEIALAEAQTGNSTADKAKMYVRNDESIRNKSEAIAANHEFSAYVSDGTSYEEKKLVFSTLPVMAVDTKAELSTEYGGGTLNILCMGRGEKYKADIKMSDSGNVLTFTLGSEASLMGNGEGRKWKAAKVREKDRTFVRQWLANEVWNVFSGGTVAGEYAELAINNKYSGLYYIYPADDLGEEYTEGLYSSDAANKADYLAFLQFAYAYENVDDLTNYVGDLKGEFTLLPRRVDYSFGILPTRIGYYSYEAQSRILSPEQLGIDGTDATLLAGVRQSWETARQKLTEDYICYITDLEINKIRNSGYEFRSGLFEDIEYFDLAAYELKQYLSQRLPYVDAYYRGEIDELGNPVSAKIETEPLFSEGSPLPEASTSENTEYSGFSGLQCEIAGGEMLDLYLRDGSCYVLLPSYAVDSPLTLSYDREKYGVWIDGEFADSGSLLCEGAEIAIASTKASENGFMGRYLLKVVKSEQLPTIYIDTFNGTMDYINNVKGNKEPGEARIISTDGEVLTEGELSYIMFRGHGTSGQAKKTYRMAFSQDTDVLGMGEAKEWILQANAVDASKIRNALAFEMADRLGIPYVSDWRYADVYFNGRYGGNYLVMEPIEVGVNRVDIDTAAGSVLIENMNKESRLAEEDLVIRGDDGFIMTVKGPAGITESEAAEIQQKINTVNTRLRSTRTQQDYQELASLIDIKSFALTYILDMVCNDIDAGYFSTFFYYNGADGKLYAGPVWDYDKSFGGQKDRAQLIRLNAFFVTWPEELIKIPSFRDEVKDTLDNGAYDLIKEMAGPWLSETADRIAASYSMDRVLWPKISKTVVDMGNLTENREYVSGYILQRLELLKDMTDNPEAYHRVYIGDEGGRIYYAKDGETISQADIKYICEIYDCKSLLRDDGSEFKEGDRITKDMILYPEGDDDD